MASIIRGSDNFDTAGGNAVKAWVNFNGTGTMAIRASYNVSSITDNGTGDYTVNFTTAMPDANYAVIGVSAVGDVSDNNTGTVSPKRCATPYTVNSIRIATQMNSDVSGIGYPMGYVNVAIFR